MLELSPMLSIREHRQNVRTQRTMRIKLLKRVV
jgi:hypothetical protein